MAGEKSVGAAAWPCEHGTGADKRPSSSRRNGIPSCRLIAGAEQKTKKQIDFDWVPGYPFLGWIFSSSKIPYIASGIPAPFFPLNNAMALVAFIERQQLFVRCASAIFSRKKSGAAPARRRTRCPTLIIVQNDPDGRPAPVADKPQHQYRPVNLARCIQAELQR